MTVFVGDPLSARWDFGELILRHWLLSYECESPNVVQRRVSQNLRHYQQNCCESRIGNNVAHKQTSPSHFHRCRTGDGGLWNSTCERRRRRISLTESAMDSAYGRGQTGAF